MTVSSSSSSPEPMAYTTRGGGFVRGKAPYHEAWEVRRYDLTNIRSDLEHCHESGRSFIAWATALFGIGTGALVTFFVALNTKPLVSLSLREGLFWGGVIFLIAGAAFVLLDRRFTVTASTDLIFVKEKVDLLISMFDKENPNGEGS